MPLKAVVIGAGYFARFHCEAWSRIPEVEIAAVCDLDPAKAAALTPARHYTDWREAIDREQPDFADIVTPPATHEEMCSYLASRGVHIVCQKPLAPTLAAARAIVAGCEAAGVRFMVHENWRWQPWYRQIKTIQKSGEIGEFTHAYFRMRTGDGWGENAYLDRQPFFRDYPRLLIYETGVHFVDTFRYLMGEIVEVYANLRRHNPAIRGEDCGQVFFRFESGATAIWDANRYNETESANPRFTFGELRIDARGGHVAMDVDSNLRLKPLGRPARDVHYERANVNFAGDSVYALQRHFVECLRTGAEFESCGADYLRTLEAVEAIYESAAAGRPTKL